MNIRRDEPVLAGRKVLVTDDAESAREILRSVLEGIGLNVSTASDGSEAVSMVKADPGRFDLILMDLVMERMDGLDAIREIHPLLKNRNCPIIAMTADRRPETDRECQDAGASGEVLRKPFRAQAVIAAVLNAIGGTGTGEGWATTDDHTAGETWSHLPQVTGCDLIGALERCGNDPALLRRLLQSFWDDGFRAFTRARAAVHQGDPTVALKQLHKLRGEMLNLGLVSLVARLMAVENELRIDDLGMESKASFAPDTTQPLMLPKARVHYDSMLGQISEDMRKTLAIVKGLPVLNAPAARSLPGPEPEDDPAQSQRFPQLVELMAVNDPAALALIPETGRLLPGSYSEQTDARFREFANALDFGAAVRLLSARDIRSSVAESAADSHRILLVDDAAVTIRLLANSLHGMGSLRFALSGEQAMEIALAWPPDLVIADVNMGEMSGIVLCRNLKEAPQTCQCTVMLISANDDVATEVEGLTAGATDFIEKPLNPARVVGRVSAQLAAITQRRESRAIYNTAGRSELTGFVTCGLDGKIIGVSPSLSGLLGRATAFYAGSQLREMFDTAFTSVLNESLGGGGTSGTLGPFETSIRNSAGALIPVRIIGRFMPSTDKRVLWLGIEDIRERVFNERQRLDQHVSRTVATLTSGIAHEFNNLLGIIIGSLDLAIESEADPAIASHLNRASIAALRAAGISRSLSESARRAIRTAGLPEVLDKLIDHAWPILTNLVPKRIRLERERCDEMLWVRLDPQELLAALTRLMENACDAMPDTGTIRIRVRADAGPPSNQAAPSGVILEVGDSGHGMSEEVRSRVQDPFFTTRSPEHVGLGLSEVNGFMARSGGTLDIESSPGAGCVVRLHFPAIA